jgi:biotin carboxyl carrier protein
MLVEIKVPPLQKNPGEITEGMACPVNSGGILITLMNWFVKDRDFVKEEAALCLLETSKASFEVPAEKDGFVRIIKKEGTIVSVDETLCLLADSIEELPA